jgi:hypothetical protein
VSAFAQLALGISLASIANFSAISGLQPIFAGYCGGINRVFSLFPRKSCIFLMTAGFFRNFA